MSTAYACSPGRNACNAPTVPLVGTGRFMAAGYNVNRDDGFPLSSLFRGQRSGCLARSGCQRGELGKQRVFFAAIYIKRRLVMRAFRKGRRRASPSYANGFRLYRAQKGILFFLMRQDAAPLDVPAIPYLLRENASSPRKLTYVIFCIPG